jgi:hypothetical protein
MKLLAGFISFLLLHCIMGFEKPVSQKIDYPSLELANDSVSMKIYLPDSMNGYYQSTRFDWSGMIYSLKYRDHEYFGVWKPTNENKGKNEALGPVNGYIHPGLGYLEADTGGEFIRIGVGVLKKPDENKYRPFSEYEFIDHGKWTTTSGKQWVEFRHEINRKTGWGYTYTKEIKLHENEPGFTISYKLQNTGTKLIETDQFNHNFLLIDSGLTGPDFKISFPFNCIPDNNPKNRPHPLVSFNCNELLIGDTLADRDIWFSLGGHSNKIDDNGFEVINLKTGAGIRNSIDQPLSRMIFWATENTLSPETFIDISIQPGETIKWKAEYKVFLASGRE